MKLPGWLWTVLLTGATSFLVALQAGVADNLDAYWAPVAIAVIGAVLKALETWKQPADGTRSVTAPRSRISRFLWGG